MKSMTIEQSLERLSKLYNGGLPDHVFWELPPDIFAVRFVPPKCAHCSQGMQLPFGYTIIRGQVVVVTICENIKCAGWQFPLLNHLTNWIQKSRGGSNGENHTDRIRPTI